MASSSLLGGAKLPQDISGKDLHALGPSDNSDSGSDAAGAYGDDELSADSDAAGTGERASAGGANGPLDADILPHTIQLAPGFGAGADRDANDDASDLDDVEELVDDSADPDAEFGDDDDEDDEDDAAPGSSSAR